jgi:hypothetical protein
MMALPLKAKAPSTASTNPAASCGGAAAARGFSIN